MEPYELNKFLRGDIDKLIIKKVFVKINRELEQLKEDVAYLKQTGAV